MKRVFNILLTILILACAIVLALYILKRPLFMPFVVTSGSMTPGIPTGSVIIVINAPEYFPGDIITYRPEGNQKTAITHRVIFKTYPQGSVNPPVYLTAGDANKSLDPIPVSASQIIGKTLFHIPSLGFITNLIKTPKGFIGLVIIPATIIVYEELKNIKNALKKHNKETAP